MMEKNITSNMVLGTAQLGMRYGINSPRQPTESETFEMLQYAFSNGINAIDTAPNYGTSEVMVGEFIRTRRPCGLFVLSKLDAQYFPERIWESQDRLYQMVENELRLSCMRLGLAQISAYITHFAEQAFRDGGAILDILTELKARGFIGLVGTSLYVGGELERCIDDKRIDVVHVPLSIIDRRLIDSGLLARAKERGIIVFARSVFAQGLVFMARVPRRMADAQEIVDRLRVLATSCEMTINELCLRYVLSIDEEVSIVVGIDSLKQLKENVEAIRRGPLGPDIMAETARLPQLPDGLIDIRSWGQRFDFK